MTDRSDSDEPLHAPTADAPEEAAEAEERRAGSGASGLRERIAVDRESVERGLAGLVLTIIELLRQLMERQAIRRIDEGDLSDAQIEDLGVTLMALEDRMTELREHFGLSPDDLNIDLGPLGPLLPRD